MKYNYKINSQIAVSGDIQNMKQFVRSVAFLDSLPRECPMCQAPVIFTYRTPQDYEYYGLQCQGEVTHETNFGQKKEGGELYYKDEWSKAYTARKKNDETPPSKEDNNEDDLPF